jgi:hypothetical protein
VERGEEKEKKRKKKRSLGREAAKGEPNNTEERNAFIIFNLSIIE